MFEFYSEDCPICRAMQPTVRAITEHCDGRGLTIEQVDISKPENRHFARTHRLVGVPTFLFVDRDGNEVARLIGHQTEEALKQALSVLRGEACPGVGALPRWDEVGRAQPACSVGAESTASKRPGDGANAPPSDAAAACSAP